MSAIVAAFYSQTVLNNSNDKLASFRDIYFIDTNSAELDIDQYLRSGRDAYLLKMKHRFFQGQSKTVKINEVAFHPFQVRKRGIIETDYFRIQPEMIHDEGNVLSVSFSQNPPDDIDVMLSNYRYEIGHNIYTLLKGSRYLPSRQFSFVKFFVAFALIFLSVWTMVFFLRFITVLDLERIILYQVYSLSPFLVFLSIILISNTVSATYSIVITPVYFLKISLISYFLIQSFMLINKFRIDYVKRQISLLKPIYAKPAMQALDYVKRASLADKCFLVFVSLLILSGSFLSVLLSPFARFCADSAFLFLMCSIILKSRKALRNNSQ